MSIEFMSLVFKRPEPANAAQRLVLLALADFADDGGTCYPSVRLLAERTRLSERGVQKATRKLEEAGLLGVRMGGIHRKTGERLANLYTIYRNPRLLVDMGEHCSPTPEQGSPMNTETPTPEHGSGGWVNTETPTPEHRSPQPSGNHHREPSGYPRARPADLSEVQSYAATLSLSAEEAATFFDHFQANGWRIGGKAPMKDWRAALRNWQRRADGFSAPRRSKGAASSQKTFEGAADAPRMTEEQMNQLGI